MTTPKITTAALKIVMTAKRKPIYDDNYTNLAVPRVLLLARLT